MTIRRKVIPLWHVGREGVDAMLSGDVETGKTILRDTIKATVGFEQLGEATDTPPKSLIRMFGPRGNPRAMCPRPVRSDRLNFALR